MGGVWHSLPSTANLALSRISCYFDIMELKDRLKKLNQALANGSPMRIALNSAGISYSDYRYWLDLFVAVEYCKQQEELNELRKSKSNLMKIREQSFRFAIYEDEDGNQLEPNPEAVALYVNSKTFKKEADEKHDWIASINEAKTKAVLLHLRRLADEQSSKATVSAAQWFLERALPTDFGKQEADIKQNIPNIKVEFVKSDGEASMKRIEEMEKSILGDRKLA